MTQRRNQLGQPIGEPVADWTPRAPPPRTPMRGRLCRLEPINAAVHAAALHAAHAEDRETSMLPVHSNGASRTSGISRAESQRISRDSAIARNCGR